MRRKEPLSGLILLYVDDFLKHNDHFFAIMQHLQNFQSLKFRGLI